MESQHTRVWQTLTLVYDLPEETEDEQQVIFEMAYHLAARLRSAFSGYPATLVDIQVGSRETSQVTQSTSGEHVSGVTQQADIPGPGSSVSQVVKADQSSRISGVKQSFELK